MNRDLHIVIEARRNSTKGLWTYRALTPALPWRDAIEVWEKVDFERIHTPFPRSMSEHYYMVRSNTDPNWTWLVRPKLRKSASSWRSREAAAKEYGTTQGISGDSGGWLRRRGQEEFPICQGWQSYATVCISNGRIRQDPDTKLWYASAAQPLLRSPHVGRVAP